MRISAIIAISAACGLASCAENPVPGNPIWSFSKYTLNDSKAKITLIDQSSNRADRNGSRADDTLVIEASCFKGRTEFSLQSDNYYRRWRGSHAQLEFQIDGQPAYRKSMRLNYDKGALLIGNSRAAKSFLESLYGHSALVITAWPGRRDELALSYNIAGIEDRLRPVRDACRW